MNLYQTQLSYLDAAKLQEVVSSINPEIKIAHNDDVIIKILSLRQKTYPIALPELLACGFEDLDTQSLILYTENEQGEIMSTCRLLFDSLKGLSEEHVYEPTLSQLRKRAKIAEWGRLIVEKNSTTRTLDYAAVISELCKTLKVDYVFMFNRDCDVNKMLNGIAGTRTLKKTNISFGSEHRFTAMLWTIPKTSEAIYEQSVWDEYAKSFMTVTTNYQSTVLREAANYLYGTVIDCGSGCAKIAPFLSHQTKIKHYTAVDASPTMCRLGGEVLNKLQKDNFEIIEAYIEDLNKEESFESAVSINSMYTWSEPIKTLQHIHAMLKYEGRFVLATLNHKLNMPEILNNIKADLMGHPDADIFIAMNEAITNNNQANIFSLDELIRITQHAGFKILSCHDQFYEGGLSFLVLEKQ